MISAALSCAVLLLLIFGGLYWSNRDAVRAYWRDFFEGIQ